MLGTLVFLIAVPGTVAGVLPWWITRWHPAWDSLWSLPLLIAGALLILAGLAVLLESFARFAIQGLGTPAPVYPTRRLVVDGWYRHVRNPMYVAVVALILGQALVLGRPWLLAYGAAVWLACHTFVVAYEEPTLRRTFGPAYDEFRAHVPRWLPRLRPWHRTR
jgi:protein-S-isoprenylcysteine O-methyltransferase Ste14